MHSGALLCSSVLLSTSLACLTILLQIQKMRSQPTDEEVGLHKLPAQVWKGLHAAAQATQAYLEGDKALAKKLGANGRWHAAQMARAHQTASDDIFRQRNAASAGALTLLPWRTASAAVVQTRLGSASVMMLPAYHV